ncbi:hypothetical protein FJT64_016847 [Amphibalanus amphitrite]|uniref:Uncharacterized protein n=1 Tax=Amphibalanus amphitrite TaxID=1232801 RepID=A0A6A4WXY9_AMPAM|nr:hypothetical protein FJT64_016847 [Amphibalanus amphitrite]
MWVPAALQTPDWFTVIIALQVPAAAACFAYQSVFDVVLIGLLDSVALYLERLDRYTRRYITGDDAVAGDGASPASEHKVRPAGDSTELGLGKKLPVPTLNQGAFYISDNAVSPKGSADFVASLVIKPSQTGTPNGLWLYSAELRPSPKVERDSADPIELRDPAGDLEAGLERLSEAYRAVYDLASDAAEFCSVPTLSLHASVTAVLLIGMYVAINLFIVGEQGTFVRVSLVIFLMLNTLRVAFVSGAGSRLLSCGERLNTTLVGGRWPRRLSPGVRHALQMLVEQTRRPPNFHGGGLFTVRKETMLSMMSFVLSYFVILVQMISTYV